jgi:hypothetical protein
MELLDGIELDRAARWESSSSALDGAAGWGKAGKGWWTRKG